VPGATAVTFKLVAQPNSARTFQFSTDVDSPSPFTLSDASPTQEYTAVDDGSYAVELLSDTTGYDVVLSCDTASSTITGNSASFDVAGDDVTCTFTLTGTIPCCCLRVLYFFC
jgi:hypothetical protein